VHIVLGQYDWSIGDICVGLRLMSNEVFLCRNVIFDILYVVRI